MGKLHDFAERQRNEYIQIVKKYKVTIVLAMIASLFYVFLEDAFRKSAEELITYVYVFLAMSAVGSFFAETGLKDKAKAWGYLFSMAGGVLWAVIAKISSDMENESADYYIEMAAVLYVLVFVGFSMVRIIRESALTFEKYAVRLLFFAVKVCVILFTLNIGILLILFMANTLLLGGSMKIWDIMGKIEALFAGFLYVPYGLICVTGKKEETSKFVRGLLLYCMMPLVLTAMGIIYLYIGKILITGTFPSNEVFNICAALFCVGVCIWTFSFAFTAEKSKNFYTQLIKYMKYLYAPFLLLEAYCIGVRIADYGLTEDRYLAVWFLIAQVIYTAWEPLVNLIRILLKKERIGYGEHYEWLIYVGIGIFILLAFMPLIQVEQAVFNSQKSRFLEAYGEEENLKQAEGAYKVLIRNRYGKKWIRENYDEDALREAMNSVKTYDSRDRIYVTQGDPVSKIGSGIPVSGYDIMYLFHLEEYNYDNPLTRKRLQEFPVEYGDKKILTDLTGLVDESLKAYEKGNYKENFSYMIEQDGRKIIFYYISFIYDREADGTVSFYAEGLVLENDKQ